MALYDPQQHRPLSGARWSEPTAREGIAEIVADLLAAYRGPQRLWPNVADDLEGEADVPMRNVYFGAAGVGWALERLACRGLIQRPSWLAELMGGLAAGYRAAPELTEISPGPGPVAALLFGEGGILLAAEAVAPDPAARDRLAACVDANRTCPTLELCWGSPGTMTAAMAMWRHTGDARWAQLWLASARWLIEQWQDPVWTQDMYGERREYVGAGHGFAGNVAALLAGRDLLDRSEADRIAGRAADVLGDLARRENGFAQWPALAGQELPRQPVQWCHGAPGIVISLAGLPPDLRTDGLLRAGGELTWAAGPLRKGPGLCHGTAGNAYALLALWRRECDERWRDRARAFAADALADVRARRAAAGHGRYTLYTGDLGVALLLADCLDDAPPAATAFPFLN